MKKLITLVFTLTLFSCAKEYKKVKVVVFFNDDKHDTLSVYSEYMVSNDNNLVHFSTNLRGGTTIAKNVKYVKEL